MGIRCVIRQFLASQDLTGDMIFRPKLFKFRPKKSVKKTKIRALQQISKLGRVFRNFLGCNPSPNFGFLNFGHCQKLVGTNVQCTPLPCDLDDRLASYHNNISVKTKIEEL